MRDLPLRPSTYHQSQQTIHSDWESDKAVQRPDVWFLAPDCANDGTWWHHTLHRPWNGYFGIFRVR